MSSTSNCLSQTYVKGFVDISGGDLIARNGNLLIAGDASLNGNVFVNKAILVGVANSIYAFDVSGISNFQNNVYTQGDVSINNRLFVGLDASFNSRLFVGNDVSFNKNLYVFGKTIQANEQ